MEKIDVIIPLGNGSHHNNDELRYLLRSMECHLKGYDKVYLVTMFCPDWIDKEQVTVVSIGDPYTENKDANLHMKTLKTIGMFDIDKFVWCADDNAFLHDIDAGSIPVLHNHRPNSIFYEPNSGRWRNRVKNTLEWAKSRGVQLPHTYESHAPQLFDGKLLVERMKDVDYVSQPGLTITTTWRTVTNTWQDSLNQPDYKWTFENPIDETVTVMPEKELCSKPFIGYNDSTSERVLARLAKMFPLKSKYEK